MSLTVLTADATYYIRTNGVDTSSRDGKSVANAWASVEYAIQQLGNVWPGDYVVNVDIGAGTFSESSTISFHHPHGRQFFFKGVSEVHTGVSVTPGTGTYGTDMTGVSAYDLKFTMPSGGTLSVGDYVLIDSVSGGTLRPEKAYGCHRVKSIAGSLVTLEACVRSNITLPTGTLTCNMTFVNTVLSFTGKSALKTAGPYNAGNWDELVFKGNCTEDGVWCLSEAVVSLGTKTGVSGFVAGLYAQNNATIFADYVKIAKCSRAGACAQNDSVLNLRGAIISGSKNRAIEAFIGATVAAYQVRMHSCGGTGGVYAYKGAFVDVQSAYIQHLSSYGVYAASGAFVYAVGATFTSNVTDCSPSANTPGNGNAYIDT